MHVPVAVVKLFVCGRAALSLVVAPHTILVHDVVAVAAHWPLLLQARVAEPLQPELHTPVPVVPALTGEKVAPPTLSVLVGHCSSAAPRSETRWTKCCERTGARRATKSSPGASGALGGGGSTKGSGAGASCGDAVVGEGKVGIAHCCGGTRGNCAEMVSTQSIVSAACSALVHDVPVPTYGELQTQALLTHCAFTSHVR